MRYASKKSSTVYAIGAICKASIRLTGALGAFALPRSMRQKQSRTPAGRFLTPNQSFAVAVGANVAYIADNLSGILAVDITNVASPSLLGSCPGLTRG